MRLAKANFQVFVLNLGLITSWASAVTAEEPLVITIRHPQAYQVVQRQAYVPQFAHEHQPGGPARGFADVKLDFDRNSSSTYEARTVLLDGAIGHATDWKRLEQTSTIARIEAGGWYRLEIRARDGENVTATGRVEPIGVGEVFVIAGQSYASNANEEKLRVQDPSGRVSVYDLKNDRWRVAHDPQPVVDSSQQGSIWPAFGDSLLPFAQVPIGLVNVAWGGTSSAQWQPDGKMFPNLVQAGTKLGNFRAILWQQGESDVIAKTSIETYEKGIQVIRTAAVEQWGFDPPWFLAKSTLHPTVYNDSAGELRIRTAIDRLCQQPGFLRGPDTDILAGANRGPRESRRHFSPLGQRNAATMWMASVWQELSRPRPSHELMLRDLPKLHLLEPAWQSPIVHRESSVLMQADDNGPITARLAFPAREIVAIASADGRREFEVSKDATLSDDGLTLTFTNLRELEFIRAKDLYLPKDSPNSYRHRVGTPEQYLMYQPGVWFHARNLEVTYRRKDLPEVERAAKPEQSTEQASSTSALKLPRTHERLRKKQPLVIGISGDSISTGLDASGKLFESPNQAGYPDLVAAQLQATFGSSITLENRAVPGWSVTHGLKDVDQLLARRPHVIVVAYGMNDVGRRDPAWFGQQTKMLLDRIKQADSAIEIILVSPMLGNSQWVHTPREMFAQYRDELQALTDPGIMLADVTSVWETLLRHKHDLDLTGNGLNHPNDFGHRLYAQAILQLFR